MAGRHANKQANRKRGDSEEKEALGVLHTRATLEVCGYGFPGVRIFLPFGISKGLSGIGTLIARFRYSWLMIWILQHRHAHTERGAKQQQPGVRERGRGRKMRSSGFFAEFTGERMASIGMGHTWGCFGNASPGELSNIRSRCYVGSILEPSSSSSHSSTLLLLLWDTGGHVLSLVLLYYDYD